MSIWADQKLREHEARIKRLEEIIEELQAKPTEQPAPPPDLRTREGKAWKNANS